MNRETLNITLFSTTRISILVGGFFYYYCLTSHICMVGHMHHPPYSTFDFAVDYIWLFFLIFATILSSLCRKKRAYIVAGILITLIANRYLFESNGGIGLLFELPLLVVAFALMLPNGWFKGLFRRHMSIPTIFFVLLFFSGLLDSLRLAIIHADHWWECFHPKMIFSPSLLTTSALVVITNEIIQRAIFKSKKSIKPNDYPPINN